MAAQPALEANLAAVRRQISRPTAPFIRLMAVLKPSLEGRLPAAPEAIAAFYETLGDSAPDAYSVASVPDAIAVRGSVPWKPVLVLYPIEFELVRLILAENIEVAISSEAWVHAAAATLGGAFFGRRLGVHIFVDTGHARTGAAPDDAKYILEAVLRHSHVFEVRGLMSHFCCNRRRDGPGAFELVQALLGATCTRHLEPGWREATLREEAMRVHRLQKRRVASVFESLSLQLAKYHAEGPWPHTALRHVASGNAVGNGETEIFYDMVRVGEALFRGVPMAMRWWSGRPTLSSSRVGRCLLHKLGGCRGGVRVQALKTLPARRGSEWCLGYGCLAAPCGHALPFRIVRPRHVASVSGVCHSYAEPYAAVCLHDVASRSILVADAIGDQLGRVVFLPGPASLWNSTTNLMPSDRGRRCTCGAGRSCELMA